ncbi:hypothetical protein B566_EDAN016558 [Ephemera danica]|nr:hypothetical protein B566_EDAN016558 [Ephemera danica]
MPDRGLHSGFLLNNIRFLVGNLDDRYEFIFFFIIARYSKLFPSAIASKVSKDATKDVEYNISQNKQYRDKHFLVQQTLLKDVSPSSKKNLQSSPSLQLKSKSTDNTACYVRAANSPKLWRVTTLVQPESPNDDKVVNKFETPVKRKIDFDVEADETVYESPSILRVKECSPSDLIMADRGFDIDDEIKAKGISIVTPAYLRGRAQFESKENETSRELAKFRVHVERAVRKIKEFKILEGIIPITLAPMYQFSKRQAISPQEAEKYGIDIDTWTNKRGPRPWETNVKS